MANKDYPMTEEECLKVGGHCYARDNIAIVTEPPTYVRQCKHCGHTQYGREQPSVYWQDAQEQPNGK